MEIANNMTIEEIMGDLASEYGEDFNWRLICSSESREHFLSELKKELGSEHSIFSNSIWAVAKCESNDDVLYLICDPIAGEIWRIYHLTYSANNTIGFPEFEEFKSRKAAADYIQQRFVIEYLT